VRDALERIQVPDSEAAHDRAHDVVLEAFASREVVSRGRRARIAAIACALLAAGVALAVWSPPGQAVVERVREVVGVERSAPALFSLPAPGRLLAASEPGVWVVEANGKKRLLRGYREASWSPFGRFVVATRPNELAALEPDGDVRWTLSRPDVRSPRWAGSPTDTRIAYVDRTGIRVVAGDGTGDRLLTPGASGPLAWRPGKDRVLAYVSQGEVRVQDVETGRMLWRADRGVSVPVRLAWSTDGRRLLVLARRSWQVFGPRGRLVGRSGSAEGRPNVDAAFRPGTHDVVVVRTHGSQSTVVDLASGRPLFEGTGVFTDVEFSPDGGWLAIGWPTADQWVFVRTKGRRAIRAVSGIAEQFRGRPRIDGWCCQG
jgi:hypothetical protein